MPVYQLGRDRAIGMNHAKGPAMKPVTIFKTDPKKSVSKTPPTLFVPPLFFPPHSFSLPSRAEGYCFIVKVWTRMTGRLREV